MLRRLKMDSVDKAWLDDLLTIEIRASEERGERLEMAGQFPAPCFPVRDPRGEIGHMGKITDGWRTYEEQFRRTIVRTSRAVEDESRKNRSTGRNLDRRDTEYRFQVIAAEHHDDQIDGLVAVEASGEVIHSAPSGIKRVPVNGGASILPLFNNPAARAEGGRQLTGPPHLDRVPPRKGLGNRRGIKTPGIGIAEAENGAGGKVHL